jgi:ribosomal protein S18 acetylase RimI-like enzyme
MELISEPLSDKHVLSSFCCGDDSLDRWLRVSALRGGLQDTGRTWVVHDGDGVVLGYYTLAGHALHREALSKTQARSLPVEVPAILLAKLAVDISCQGQGVGKDLLLEAFEHCVSAGGQVAARYVVVDAIDDHAASFYEKFGFQRIPKTDPIRLLRRLKDIEADLAADPRPANDPPP